MRGEPAKREDWKAEPMPAQRRIISFHLAYTPDEFEIISAGLIPVEMEDRWFVYRFEAQGDKIVATQAIVNRDPAQYAETSDIKDMDFLRRLLGRLIQGLA